MDSFPSDLGGFVEAVRGIDVGLGMGTEEADERGDGVEEGRDVLGALVVVHPGESCGCDDVAVELKS